MWLPVHGLPCSCGSAYTFQTGSTPNWVPHKRFVLWREAITSAVHALTCLRVNGRYVLVQGDYAGRVQGAVYSLLDPDHPQQLTLQVGSEGHMHRCCSGLPSAIASSAPECRAAWAAPHW